tara:strand:+ start:1042 stop:1566 length:525 start_codon:yes stop_codon:yes gene_type:complete
MKNVTKITQAMLRDILLARKSATFVSIETVTHAQKSKAKLAQVILKTSYINGIVRFDYSKSVGNQEKREGFEGEAFKVQPRKWGVRLEEGKGNCPVVEHKGALYMTIKPEKVVIPAQFFTEGKEVSKEEIEHLLPVARPSKTQDHLTKEVIVRDYKFDSIKFITIGGERFELIA